MDITLKNVKWWLVSSAREGKKRSSDAVASELGVNFGTLITAQVESCKLNSLILI